jgi:TatD DNase family protein
MSYSDSHVHLDSYPPEKLKLVFDQMKAKQVELVLNVGSTLESSEKVVKMAHEYRNVRAAVGIHPGMAVPLTADIKKHLEELSIKSEVVAIGEIGIEYHGPDGRPKSNINIKMQEELFLYQLSLAGNAHLPVDIHYSMDAQEEILEILSRKKD